MVVVVVVVLDVVVGGGTVVVVDVVVGDVSAPTGTVPPSTSAERGEQAVRTNPSPMRSRFTSGMVPIS
jgi:hypothetical protein